MNPPRVFVSHSHADNALVEPFIKDLKAAGVQVWVDLVEIDRGDFIERMNDGLAQCDRLVLIVTPHSLDSRFVAMKVNAALNRYGPQKECHPFRHGAIHISGHEQETHLGEPASL